MNLIEVAKLAKSFRGLRAVNEVSFSVAENSIVALIGPNGAGKTTLFNLIAGTLAPDSGTISFAGKRIDGLRSDQICARGIGRTFQIVKPFAGLSVLDNVVVGALHRESNLAAARANAAEILAKLGLEAKRDLPAAALTLPDRKRLEVARTLATKPKLLLLDEVVASSAASTSWSTTPPRSCAAKCTSSIAAWNDVLATNLTGAFLVSRAVLPGMIRRKSGSIVFISSTAGKRGDARGAAYCASKFGMMGLAHSLLYEVRRHDIRVVVVSPSGIDTRREAPDPDIVTGARPHASDVAASVVHCLGLPRRVLVREVEIWGTNP